MTRLPGPRALPFVGLVRVLAAVATVAGCAGAPPPPVPPPGPPLALHTDTQIISPRDDASRKELLARATVALQKERWREAVDALEMLRSASKVTPDPDAVTILFDLGVAYEGLGEREKAREAYREVSERFGERPESKPALLRQAAIDADLEAWTELAGISDTLLARRDLDSVDHMSAMAGRALSHVELGDDVTAMREVQDGLDEMESLGFGATGRLPPAAAEMRFALAEVRRIRSEKIAFIPVTPDFIVKIEVRCQGLLDAQNAYADTMRSEDPHWAAMSGYHVGAMYRALHHDLMAIPPTEQAKTTSDRNLFFAMMHMRYRVLLEKGLEMMKRTSAFASKNPEVLPWAQKAEQARADMEQALVDEKATMASFPYTEEAIQKALAILEKKALEKQARK